MGILVTISLGMTAWVVAEISQLKQNGSEQAAAISAIQASRFTSEDAMTLAAAQAQEALDLWKAIGEIKTDLGRKIDAVDVPPPTVIRMFEEHTRRLDRHDQRLDALQDRVGNRAIHQ